MTTKDRFDKMIAYFSQSTTVFETELKYHNPYELIVAVILSAQCTDKRVNIISPVFFKHFPDVESLAKATVEEIFLLIKSCSYPNNKAKNLSGMAKALVHKFHSQIPSDTELLQQLPGVGRKSAHVLASVLYNKPVLAVDTHVFRVSARIGLTRNAKNPLQCEQQLTKVLTPSQIPLAHHWLLLHGRYICTARNPKCSECGLNTICVFFKKGISKKK
jgi:endonuclease III